MRILRRLVVALVVVLAGAAAAFAHPGSGIVVDRNGHVYFVDTGDGVWMIDISGKLARHGGPRFHWMAIDENATPFGDRLPSIPGGEITPVGTNPTLLVSSDVPLVIGQDGALYYPEFGTERLQIIRFTRAGVRSVRATLPARATGGVLRWINGLAAGPEGSLYYTEDKALRKIDGRGVVSTIAEAVNLTDCTSIPGNEPEIEPYLRGLAVASDGNVFVAASGCGAVLKITPRGTITTVLRTTAPWSPTAVAVSAGGVYVQEYFHTAEEDRQAWAPRVRKILPGGSIVTVAAVERRRTP